MICILHISRILTNFVKIEWNFARDGAIQPSFQIRCPVLYKNVFSSRVLFTNSSNSRVNIFSTIHVFHGWFPKEEVHVLPNVVTSNKTWLCKRTSTIIYFFTTYNNLYGTKFCSTNFRYSSRPKSRTKFVEVYKKSLLFSKLFSEFYLFVLYDKYSFIHIHSQSEMTYSSSEGCEGKHKIKQAQI